MRELSVQASTGTLNSSDTSAVQKEIDSLIDEVDRIASSTKFNDRNLLTGTTKGAVGASLTAGNGLTTIDASAAKAGTFQIDSTAVSGGSSDVTLSYTDSNGVVTTQKMTVTVPTGSNTTDVMFDKVGIKLTVNSGLGSGAGISATNTFTVASSAATATDVQVGANTGTAERIQISIGDMSTTGLGIRNLKSDNATTMVSADQTAARNAVDAIDKAIKSVSNTRAELGATQNRLEHTVSNLQTVSENLTAAQSRIRDVDMASEMANFTKNNILQQASQAMLAQANQSTQGILSLLR
jgi:flagellin